MPKVRSNGAARWAQRTAAATGDYQAGVASPRVSWSQATVAAKEAHKAGINAALAAGSFEKGVQRAGDGKWSAAAQGKGAERFGPGAAAGVQDYATGVAKFLQVIESTPLPPRGPKGDPRNIQRVAVLAAALRKAKTGSALVVVLALVALVGLSLVLVFGLVLHGGPAPRTPRDVSEVPRGAGASGRHWVFPAWLVALAATKKGYATAAALDIVSAFTTAAGAAGTAAAAAAGDSLAIRNTTFDNKPIILQYWAKNQVAGFGQFTHPSGNDVVRDFRAQVGIGTPLPLFSPGLGEPVEPQELLGVTIAGSAVAGDIETNHFQIYYPDLPGTAARFIDVDAMVNRAVNQVTIFDTTTATAGGAYGGSRALNAASDLLRANTDYALLGAHVTVLCGALTVRGVDSGNLRVGIPGMPLRPDITGTWFVQLTEQFGIPLIPVFNSANKAGIFIENITDENLAAVPFSLILVQLSPG